MDVLKIFQMDEPITKKLLKNPNSKSANSTLMSRECTTEIGKIRKQLFHNRTDSFILQKDENETMSKEKMLEITKRLKDIEIPNNENRFLMRKSGESSDQRVAILEQQVKSLERKNQELDSELMQSRQNFIRFQENEALIVEQNNKIKQLENELRSNKESNIGDCVSTNRNSEYEKVMMEYEVFLVKLMEEKAAIQKEKDAITSHLLALETAFNELLEKYERAKQVVIGFKINENSLKRQIENWRKLLYNFDQKYSVMQDYTANMIADGNLQVKDKSEVDEVTLRAKVFENRMRINDLKKREETENTKKTFAPLKHALKKRSLK